MLRHNLLNLRLFIDEGAGELRELRELRRWGDGEMGRWGRQGRYLYSPIPNSQFPIPQISAIIFNCHSGEVAEWLKAADC
ncbi:MAG: hypothetical protein F6J96_18880 [Symploca sp. SIO1C2]|nr:hypothetical protein [Symploca sp. SIO1C2]